MFWTNGFVYDAKKVKAIDPNAPVDSWAMMFDPALISKFSPCGVCILDSPEDVIDLAQNYLHLHPGKNDPAEIKQAADLVAKLQPHVAQFDSTRHHRRAGRRQPLPGDDLVRRLLPGGQPGEGGGLRRRTALFGAEGRREYRLRHHGDLEGRQERRRGA